MTWCPHITVATIVPSDDGQRFLFVEEYADSDQLSINQPAGHLDPNESLIEAAQRETFEETGWQVDITGFIGIALYTGNNGITYQRNTFVGRTVKHDLTAPLDTGIMRCLWLSPDELYARQHQWRSELVGSSLQHYLNGNHYPLTIFYT